MQIGTKSVLFGAHAFWLHPWFVAWAWFKTYGFERVHVGMQYAGTLRDMPISIQVTTSLWDPRLWITFFIHDLGYWGCADMDGKDGEYHPVWAACWMFKWFGTHWYWFTILHSRYMAKKFHQPPSALCWADKFALTLTPWWLYLPMVKLTGEIREYRASQMIGERDGGAATYSKHHDQTDKEWVVSMQAFCRKLAEERIHAA